MPEDHPVRLAMFPLGSVLLPSMLLPLHVFEPRYRQLVADCLAGDVGFGVVLIERGSEVGGGDVRTSVGTEVAILEAAPVADGRWLLTGVGTRRLRVARWLVDDPYPRAEIEPWPDPPPTDSIVADLADTVVRLRRVLAERAALGDAVSPAPASFDRDPVVASYQAVAASPLGPADRQVLLAAPTVDERVRRLDELLADDEELLARRRELGG